MKNKDDVKMSEEELVEILKKYDKTEINLMKFSIGGIGFGLIGTVLFLLLGINEIALIFAIFTVVGATCMLLANKVREKSEKLVMGHLGDFYEEQKVNTFGPRMNNKEMKLTDSFLKQINPFGKSWERYNAWGAYESIYHDVHFYIANISLIDIINYGEDTDRVTIFDGTMIRCKDIIDPSLDVTLCGPDNGCTSNGQIADVMVVTQLREMIAKLEALNKNYKVECLVLRNGEMIVGISGYAFAQGLPKNCNTHDLDGIRKRLVASLKAACEMIDIIHDYSKKI